MSVIRCQLSAWWAEGDRWWARSSRGSCSIGGEAGILQGWPTVPAGSSLARDGFCTLTAEEMTRRVLGTRLASCVMRRESGRGAWQEACPVRDGSDGERSWVHRVTQHLAERSDPPERVATRRRGVSGNAPDSRLTTSDPFPTTGERRRRNEGHAVDALASSADEGRG